MVMEDLCNLRVKASLANGLVFLGALAVFYSYHINAFPFASGFRSSLIHTISNSSPSNLTVFNATEQPRNRSHNASVDKKQTQIHIHTAHRTHKVEIGLKRARAAIRKAVVLGNNTKQNNNSSFLPITYRNVYAFQRSYEEMEKRFKMFVYPEGEPPLVHAGPCKDIYTTEGWFINQLEMGNPFLTSNPEEASVYFLPFSVVNMVSYIYKPKTYDREPMKRFVRDYINVVSHNHPFWNRSLGADHFMLSCHDWGPIVSTTDPYLSRNSIRVLCNANASEGFNPVKDAALPEVMLYRGVMTGLGGPSALRRSVLAFFAGGNHGHLRTILFKHWKGKDEDIQVYEYLPNWEFTYYDLMKKSKYCLCPSGYEVASPRIVEAIYSECVPVIISDHYVLPFSDVLNWKAFSVQLPSSEIPNLKKILQSISVKRYVKMQRRVKQIQRHFLVNQSPKPYDMFHMILHSIWLRRLNIEINED